MYHLSDELARALVHGREAPLKEFTPAQLQPSAESGASIDKYGRKIFVRLEGISQIFYFTDVGSGTNMAHFFYVHTPELNHGDKRPLENGLAQRLDSLSEFRRQKYKGIFDKPIVQSEIVDFRGVPYRGLSVGARLIEIPRGPHGKLSGSLSEYCYNIIAWPAFAVAKHQSLPGPKDWKEF